MRLIRLSANMATFRTVEFNEVGLSLIVGGRESTDPGETFNGVGKSLLIFLVDFCLGASKRNELTPGLGGWVFTLEFFLDGRAHTVQRSVDHQDKVVLNGEELPLRAYTEYLGSVFSIPDGVHKLSFRSLIAHFIRQSREGYQSFDKVSAAPISPYERQLRLAFLLGLDVRLTQAKHQLRQTAENIRRSRKQFEADPVIRDILSGGMELELEVSEAADETDRLRRQLASFRVADNYESIQQAARDLRAQIAEQRNELHLRRQRLDDIERSLSLPADLDATEVVQVYEEAAAAVPESVVKRLEDVLRFHEALLVERRERLEAERERILGDVHSLDAELRQTKARLDETMQFLGTHNALAEFITLSEQLAVAAARHDRLARYQRLLDEYDARLAAIARDMQEENIRAIDYLQKHRAVLHENLETFRGFARRAYPGKKAGIIVENNPGDNQVRFDIDARIEADASDGINEVKIFCFDMTILLRKHNHDVQFVLHDSRLFSDIDPRQRTQVLLAAADAARHHGLQYIATLNEDQLDAIKPELTQAQYSELVEESTVLRLTDHSPSGKLLGIDIDLRYERSTRMAS